MPPAGSRAQFDIEDFDAAVPAARIEELRAAVVKPRPRDPPDGDGGPNHWEVWWRDPSGCTVVLASPERISGQELEASDA
jgi:hypothetical protein